MGVPPCWYARLGVGGYGDPFTRDPQAELDDVLDEKITVGYVEREYGVAVDATTGCVDSGRTRRLPDRKQYFS